MNDLFFLLIVAGFFVLMAGLVNLCQWLMEA